MNFRNQRKASFSGNDDSVMLPPVLNDAKAAAAAFHQRDRLQEVPKRQVSGAFDCGDRPMATVTAPLRYEISRNFFSGKTFYNLPGRSLSSVGEHFWERSFRKMSEFEAEVKKAEKELEQSLVPVTP